MYDYVIVGAGAAGCVLAARLTEDPDVNVLLLEAGPADTSDFVHIPAAFSALFRTQQDWDHMTAWEPGLAHRSTMPGVDGFRAAPGDSDWTRSTTATALRVVSSRP